MANGTQTPGQTFVRADGRVRAGSLESVWGKIKLVLVRSVFWPYERGSWQYDIICVVILAFIFLLPHSWFRDRPTLELTNLRHNQGVIEITHTKTERIYQIDSRLVESLQPAALEDAIRQILERRLRKAPNVKTIEPIRDRNNVVLGYTVVVSQ
jgi:hypothetical protein